MIEKIPCTITLLMHSFPSVYLNVLHVNSTHFPSQDSIDGVLDIICRDVIVFFFVNMTSCFPSFETAQESCAIILNIYIVIIMVRTIWNSGGTGYRT